MRGAIGGGGVCEERDMIRPCEFPSAAQGVFHDRGDGNGAVAITTASASGGLRGHVFAAKVVHNVNGFGGGEQRDACAVSEEA